MSIGLTSATTPNAGWYRSPLTIRVTGTSANGQPAIANGGPNLTHLMSRECFRGCTLEVNEENLRRWVADPRSLEAGSFMPDYQLTSEQIDQVVAFLMTLE